MCVGDEIEGINTKGLCNTEIEEGGEIGIRTEFQRLDCCPV